MPKTQNKIQWTPEMVAYLKDNYKTSTNKQLAEALGLKLTSTRTKLYSLGLKRMNLEYWIKEQIIFLTETYQTIGDTELAAIFNTKWNKQKGWTKKHIEKKRRYLNLKRTEDQKRAIKKRNKELGCWNESAIKKWQTIGLSPIGTIKVWKVGTQKSKLIKTENGYVYLSRKLWEQHFGPIPKHKLVSYKDGNPLNCTIENLHLITRAENALINRNNVYKAPFEVKQTLITLNKLNNKLKEITK